MNSRSFYWQRKLEKAKPVNLSSDTTPYPILMSSEINVPMTLGIIRPKIYVPVQWKQWSTDCRAMILRHELTHIQRRDGLFRVLQLVIQALYAFHPLVWLLSKKVDEYREMACDDASVGVNRSMSVEYARALVQIAESLMPKQPAHASASALIKQRNELLNRVQYQMEDAMKSASKWKTGLIITLLLLLIVPLSWTKSQVGDEPPPPGITGEKQINNGNPKKIDIPPDPDESAFEFIEFDTGPEPIGGLEAIMKNLDYPELARKAGVEGRVLVRARISETGEVIKTFVQGSLGDNGCDEAAVAAIKSVKWQPAMQDDKPITVWIAVPVDFKLNSKSDMIIHILSDNLLLVNDKKMSIDDFEKTIHQLTKDDDIRLFLNSEPDVNESTVKRVKNIVHKKGLWMAVNYSEQIDKTDEDMFAFVEFDKGPEPIGGYRAIQKNLHYPELARKAGVEGRVLVRARISETGEVLKTLILQSLGDNGCDEAAVAAIKSVKWQNRPCKTINPSLFGLQCRSILN